MNPHRSSAADNFITFYAGGGPASDAVGAIEGNGAGGIGYASGSADFAEWIPRQKADEKIEAGNIVGIANGKSYPKACLYPVKPYDGKSFPLGY